MKTAIMTLAAVLTFGLIFSQFASAAPSLERKSGYGCGGPGYGQSTFSKEDLEARQKFYEDTRESRKQLFELQKEYATVLNTDQVDKDRAEELWSEMFDLRNEIQKLAKDEGVLLGGPSYCLGPNGYYEGDTNKSKYRGGRTYRNKGGRWINI
jgi:Spy/CpxP family protein refolding chaperone